LPRVWGGFSLVGSKLHKALCRLKPWIDSVAHATEVAFAIIKATIPGLSVIRASDN
jgi:hypothetical protein